MAASMLGGGRIGARARRTWRPAVLAGALLALLGATATATAAGAGAAPRPPMAVAVGSAALRQAGARIAWTARLQARWSAARLRGRGRRQLCLLVAQAHAPHWAALCVDAARDGSLLLRRSALDARAQRTGPQQTIAGARLRLAGRRLTAGFPMGAADLRPGPLDWRVLTEAAGADCARRVGAPRSGRCGALTPARRARSLTLVAPRPDGCVSGGPSLLSGARTSDLRVALTFDDGPGPDTPRVLDELERLGVRATFFEIGRQISGHDAVLRRMLDDGDVIGNHSWSHPNLSAGGVRARRQLTSTDQVIERAAGFAPCLFRPPYGAVSPALIDLAGQLGLTTVTWNVDPADWRLPGTSAIVDRVLAQVRPGSIVLLHDGGGPRAQTVAALPAIVGGLRARGYRLLTVPELLGLRVRYATG